jgi:S-adenosylmethionine synthetase
MIKLITSESCAFGHPDKIADQISDALLDAFLEKDPNTKAGIEVMVKDNCVVLGGEIKTDANIDYHTVVKKAVKEIGFSKEHGFNEDIITIINLIGKQSPEINKAVELSDDNITAGDQGFMVGYATNETPNYMPLGMYIAKLIVDWVVEQAYFGNDAKSQITIEEDTITGKKRIHTILVSTIHSEFVELEIVRDFIEKNILSNSMFLDDKTFNMIDKNTKIVVNPAGRWTVGGPVSDAGLTGRKIIVDQYGAYTPVGGGAFSGKDASKVDRSGAYLCRYIAKNIVKSGITNRCKIELAYMIGIAEPASINIDTYGEGDEELLLRIIKELFPLTPSEIINHFGLNRPIYYQTARYGHFGLPNRPWEETDLSEKIRHLYTEA